MKLITGFLGSGKTTAIRALLDERPVGQRWLILMNEYGTVSIDQTEFDAVGAEVNVQELAGGCMCCTMSVILDPLLARFLHQTKPDRLIIASSGLAHPAFLIDKLRGPNFRRRIDLRATVCVVDPGNLENRQVAESAVFHDQIQAADVVALNWTDCRSRAMLFPLKCIPPRQPPGDHHPPQDQRLARTRNQTAGLPPLAERRMNRQSESLGGSAKRTPPGYDTMPS